MKSVRWFASRASVCAFVLTIFCGIAIAQIAAPNQPPRDATESAAELGVLPPAPSAESKPLDEAPLTLTSEPSVERAALADLGPTDGSPSSADIPSTAAPVDTTQYKPVRCDIDSLGRCIKDLLQDEAGMWTSPLRIRKRDLLWLLPLGAATAATLATDAQASKAIGFRANQMRYSKDFSDAMEDTAWATAGGLYVFGKITHNETARETGVLSIEAGIDATIVVEILKLATNRLRPDVGQDSGDFWADDTDKFTTSGSFPSGHAIAVWAVAKVISDETPGNRWLHIGLYLLATATAVTRVTAQEHFPSDVLVGSALGYLIGGYVYRHHSEAGGREGEPIHILPFADAATHAAGLAVSMDPASIHFKSPQQLWSDLRGSLPFGSN